MTRSPAWSDLSSSSSSCEHPQVEATEIRIERTEDEQRLASAAPALGAAAVWSALHDEKETRSLTGKSERAFHDRSSNVALLKVALRTVLATSPISATVSYSVAAPGLLRWAYCAGQTCVYTPSE